MAELKIESQWCNMKNIPVGSIVKGFTKLGSQTKEKWTRGTYIGNNKVEFWTGVVVTLPDDKIKEYKRFERIGQEYPEQAEPYKAIHQLLGGNQNSRTVQMWTRLGAAKPIEPSPRKDVEAFIAKA